MLVLYKYTPAWGLPDISPFCIKVETYLRMTQVPYRTEVADPRKAPKAKLPYIECEGRTIADSSLIIEFLKERFGDALDEGLSSRERALCQAVGSMLEEHLYFVVLYQRWQQDTGWATYKPILAQYARQVGIPTLLQSLLLPTVRKGVVTSLHGQGLGRHSPDEVNAIGKRIVDSVSELLGEGPYFCGERLRSFDATLYAFLAALTVPPFESELCTYARAQQNLVAYRDRLRAEIYPSPAGG